MIGFIVDIGNTAAKMNYYALLAKLDPVEIKNCKVRLVGARQGGGLLQLMKDNKMTNQPDHKP